MINATTVTGTPITTVFSRYSSGKYSINRTYQRKLVWSVEEKRSLIDSIVKGFPIPMILTTKSLHIQAGDTVEILDGLQRLNAIVSFIEGEFNVDGKYFDLSTVAQTKQLLDNGEFVQKQPVLEKDLCIRFLDYTIPFSTCSPNSQEEIDETFRRINTAGKTLSLHEVRQAGCISSFADLVNKCAIFVRGDSSHSSILDLSKMREISLSNSGLPYGIDTRDIFWTQNGIITYQNLRQSRDEELIAHLIAYMSMNMDAETTSIYLDSIYTTGSPESKRINDEIQKHTVDSFYRQFCRVFSELEKTLEHSKGTFKALMFSSERRKVTQVFQVVFISLYNLLIQQNKIIANYEELVKQLDDLYDSHLQKLSEREKWNKIDRINLVNSVIGVIQRHFIKRATGDHSIAQWGQRLEVLISQAKTEQANYDFKIGITSISKERTPLSVSKIVKTLVAMTNTCKGDCYIIVGVADTKEDADLHHKVYGSNPINYKNFHITGIDGEASAHGKDLGAYLQQIVQHIKKEPVDTAFKEQILTSICTFTYQNREILILKSSRSKQPQMYDGNYFKRHLSHTSKVEQTELFDFFQQFSS